MAEEKIICRAQVIEDYNYGQLIPREVYNPYDISHMVNPYNLSIYNDGRKLPGAANKTDPRRYHQWDNLNQLKTPNGVANCGIAVKSRHIDDVVNGIHYYRDTGAIAGCSGTFCKPATLRFSKFNLREKGLNEHCKITSIGVVFEHRRTAVATPDNGTPPYECVKPKLNASLGLSMDGLDIYPQYKALRHWLSVGNTQITAVFGDGERIPNPPHKVDANTNQPVWQKWAGRHMASSNPGLTIENVLRDDFCLYMDYGVNLMGDRGILYLKNVYLEIFYEEGEPYIAHAQSSDTIKTSPHQKCRTKIEHHILAGFKDSKGLPINPKKPFNELTPEEQEKQYCSQHVQVNTNTIPEGVVVTKKQVNGSEVIFEVEDKSCIEGEKKIDYYLDNFGLTDSVYFNSILMQRPIVDLKVEYKKNAPYEAGTQYISLKAQKNACCDVLKIYFDDINTTPLTFDIKYLKDNINLLNYNANGVVDDTYIRQFYNKVQTLSCGQHTLFIQIGSDMPSDKFIRAVINIKPQEYLFSIYDPNNKTMTYPQNKSSPNQTIKIKRIDSEPSESISIVINDESKLDNSKTIINNVRKGVEYSYTTNKYYPGKFHITVQENAETCTKGKTVATVTVTPTAHKQYHDQLFVRGEDSTSFTYDYLVAWEGDNIKFPILVDSIEKGHAIEDILLCSKDTVYAGLSQTKTIPLTVKNIGNSGTIKNCQIELNALNILEDGTTQVTTEDWTQTNGIFYNFYKKFMQFNKHIANKIELKNIDQNNNITRGFSLTGEENVYIRIKELPEDESITIEIPFSSKNPQVKALEFRIFQDVVKFNTANCTGINSNQSDKVMIYVYDSILTELTIDGKTDILNPATTKADCPNVCYKTEHEKNDEPDGITYRVTNIDSSNYEDAGIDKSHTAPLKIENSMEMVPYAYKFKNGQKTNIGDQTNISNKLILTRDEEEKYITLNNQLINAYVQFSDKDTLKVLKQRTNQNGEVIFDILIPYEYNKNYTIEELLSEVVYIEYAGDIENLPATLEIGDLQKLETRITPYGVIYKNKTYLKDNTTAIPKNASVQLLYKFQYKYLNKWYSLSDQTVFLYQGNTKKQILISSNKSAYNISANIITASKQTAKQLLNSYSVVFGGNARYSQFNPINVPITDTRDETRITFIDDWKVYKPGQVAQIRLELSSISKIVKNYILFNAEINEPTSYDEVTIFYKMCNLQEYQCNIGKIDYDKARICERNKGIFNTTFSTDTYKLVENQVSKNIYCGIDNDIQLATKLEKDIIQSGDINVIYLVVSNNIKDSKDVKIYINLGKQPYQFIGDYEYLNVENSDGDFSYTINQDEETNDTTTTLIWAIGDMEANTKANAIIKIKADEIGLSNIKIEAEDYNHKLGAGEVIVGKDPCEDWQC